jgi:hypothetical protein
MAEIEKLTELDREDLERRGAKSDIVWKAEQNALRVIDAQAKETRRLERFAALALLEWNDAEGGEPRLVWLLDNMPPGVAALVREHLGAEIGDCHDCGRRAPLKHKPERPVMFRERVCAWGCGDP